MRPAVRTKLRIAALGVAMFDPMSVHASDIWDGGGANNNWTTGQNWNGRLGLELPPRNNGTADIVMAGDDRTSPLVDVPYSINSLTFNAGIPSFIIGGQELTIGAGGITNNDNSIQSVSAPIKLAAHQAWNAAAGLLNVGKVNLDGFRLSFGGPVNTSISDTISGSGGLTLPAGYAGTVTLSGSASNTFTGDTNVDGGVLVLQKSGRAVAIAGGLDINGGTVRLAAEAQRISPGRRVHIRETGTFDFNGHSALIDDLAIAAGGSVTTNAGKLVLGQRLSTVSSFTVGAAAFNGNLDLGGGTPTLEGNRDFGAIVVNGPISNGGAVIRGLAIYRGSENTYTGRTIVENGASLYLAKSSADGAIRGDLTIKGFVWLRANEQILAAPGNEVLIDGGDLAIDNFTETVQDLTLRDGRVIGIGQLKVLGTIRAAGQSGIGSTLDLSGARTIDVEQSAEFGIGGNVTNGSIVKQGAGTLRLSPVTSNSYAGGTFLNGGVLSASTEAFLGDPTGGLHFNGGTLRFYSTITRNITWGPNGGGFDVPALDVTLPTQSLSGSGPLTKSGPGKLVLLAPQSYTGGTSILAGSIEGHSQSLQGNIISAGVVIFNQPTDGTYAGNLSGAGSLTKTGTGTLLLSGNNTYTGMTTVDAGTLRLANSSAIGNNTALVISDTAGTALDLAGHSAVLGSLAGGGTSGGNVTLGTATLTTGADNSSTTFSGIISGDGSLTKAGSGLWILAGNNTYAGGTTFAGGIVSASADSNLGSPTAPLRFDGGTLRVTGDFNTTARAIELLSGGGTFDIANTSGAFTYSADIAGSGGFTKIGTGSLILEGRNTYAGPTNINAGALRARLRQAIPDNSAVTLAESPTALLELNNSAETIGSLSGGGPAGGHLIINGATLTTGVDNTSTTFAGNISGNGALAKRGSGIFTLSGMNTSTGPTLVEQGTLRLNAATAIPNGQRVVIAQSGILDFNGFDRSISILSGEGKILLGDATLTLDIEEIASTFSGQIIGDGRLIKTGSRTLTLNGTTNYTGGTAVEAGQLRGTTDSLKGSITNNATLEFLQTFDGIFAGNLTGAGSLIKTGSGRLAITKPATYTGPTTVSAGTLSLANTLNTPGDSVVVDAGATLEASGILQRAISVQGALTATGNLLAGDLTQAAGVQVSAVHVGPHAVVLLDADRAQLGGGSIGGGSLHSLAGIDLSSGTFSGHGTVSGAFINNGIVAGPSDNRAISFAGPLSGAGSYSGNIRILESFSPGNSPAIVQVEGNLAFTPSSTLQIEIGGTTPGSQHDQVRIGGNATLDGTMQVTFLDAFRPTHGQQFTVLTYGSRTGTFDAITGLDLGQRFQLLPVYNARDLTLIASQGGSGQWGIDSGGLASVATNWIGAIPNAPGDVATFGNIITQPRTVTIDTSVIYGRMNFDSAQPYTLAASGPGAIALQSPLGGIPVISVTSGAHQISAPLSSTGSVNLTVAGSASLAVTSPFAIPASRSLQKQGGGSADFTAGLTLGAGSSLNVQQGTLSTSNLAGPGAVSVVANASLTATHIRTTGLTLNGTATLRPSGNGDVHDNAGTSVLNTLTVNGKLDLSNNGLILKDPLALASIRTALIAGRGSAGGVASGKWNGATGITSASAAAMNAALENRVVGYALNGVNPLVVFTEFLGQPTSSGDLLLRYTRNADANLDGVVNNNDITLLAGFYRPGTTGRHWYEGDFNFDGETNNNDITILAGFYAPSAQPLAAANLIGVAAVPEPSAALLVLAAAGLTCRRRRSS